MKNVAAHAVIATVYVLHSIACINRFCTELVTIQSNFYESAKINVSDDILNTNHTKIVRLDVAKGTFVIQIRCMSECVNDVSRLFLS